MSKRLTRVNRLHFDDKQFTEKQMQLLDLKVFVEKAYEQGAEDSSEVVLDTYSHRGQLYANTPGITVVWVDEVVSGE